MNFKSFLFSNVLATVVLAWTSDALADLPSRADEEQLTKIEQAWGQAYVKRDPDLVQKLTTEDFMMVEPDGNIMTKPAYIKSITGDVTFTEFKIQHLKIRTWGDTGIVIGVASIKANEGKQDLSGNYCFTDIFVRQNGEWKAISGHVSVLPETNRPGN
jgi:ketosteroid isomerase-like protein